jgi:hypothetical protein
VNKEQTSVMIMPNKEQETNFWHVARPVLHHKLLAIDSLTTNPALNFTNQNFD